MPLIVAIVMAYLIGSLSFAIIVSRIMGLSDPRSYGSGNPGATNVLRSGNKKAAALTLFGDALKGAIPVLLVRFFGEACGVPPGPVALAAVALAAFVGHLWPVFFRFQGGKGVATALGVLVAMNPWMGLACLLTWLFMAFVVKISSLSALVAAALAPLYAYFLMRDAVATGLVLVLALLLVWRHKKNILGLLHGTESRIGQDSSSDAGGA